MDNACNYNHVRSDNIIQVTIYAPLAFRDVTLVLPLLANALNVCQLSHILRVRTLAPVPKPNTKLIKTFVPHVQLIAQGAQILQDFAQAVNQHSL